MSTTKHPVTAADVVSDCTIRDLTSDRAVLEAAPIRVGRVDRR